MNLNNRLEKLEAIAGTGKEKITAIFRVIIQCVDGKPKRASLAGWQITDGENVMRLEGETDESLQARATSIATVNAGSIKIPRLIQITGD